MSCTFTGRQKKSNGLLTPKILGLSLSILGLSSCKGILNMPAFTGSEKLSVKAFNVDIGEAVGFTNIPISFGRIPDEVDAYCIQENSFNINDCSWIQGELPTEYVSERGEGRKQLGIWLRNSAGVRSSLFKSKVFFVDMTAPTWSSRGLSHSAYHNSATQGPEVSFNDSAEDNLTGVTYQYAIGSSASIIADIQNWTSLTSSSDFYPSGFSGLSDGQTYYVSMRARDAAGNVSSAVTSSGWTVDFPPSPPLISINASTQNPSQNDDPHVDISFEGGNNFDPSDSITIYAQENCGGTTLTLDTASTGFSTASVTAEISTGQLSGGTHRLSVKVTDVHGSTTCSSSASVSGDGTSYAEYIRDLTPPPAPAIILSSPSSSPDDDPTPTFSITLTGGASFLSGDTLSLHEGADCSGSSVGANLNPGTGASALISRTNRMGISTRTFRVKVTDYAGNSTCSSTHLNNSNGFAYATYEFTGEVHAVTVTLSPTDPYERSYRKYLDSTFFTSLGLWNAGTAGSKKLIHRSGDGVVKLYEDCVEDDYLENISAPTLSGAASDCFYTVSTPAIPQTAGQMYTSSLELAIEESNGDIIDIIDITFSAEPPCYGSRLTGSPFAFGDGSADAPYLICTATQLQQIGSSSAYFDDYFDIDTDIDLTSMAATAWNPIGNDTTAFTGKWNTLKYGGTRTPAPRITGFSVSKAATDYVGFFGHISNGAVIRDLDLETKTSATILGEDYVGLIGSIHNTTLTDVATLYDITLTVKDSATFTGQDYLGAIGNIRYDVAPTAHVANIYNIDFVVEDNLTMTGRDYVGTIGRIYTADVIPLTGTATASYSILGGVSNTSWNFDFPQNGGTYNITGRNAVGLIAGSVATPLLLSSGTNFPTTFTNNIIVSGHGSVGGLAGEGSGLMFGGSGSTISNVDVTGTGSYVGGVAGVLYQYNWQLGKNSYIKDYTLGAAGSVTATGVGEAGIGGLVGAYFGVGAYTSTESIYSTKVSLNVSAPDSDSVGGIAGSQGGCSGGAYIARSAYIGTVTGRDYVGGISGSGCNAAIYESYSQGSVNGRARTGGLHGYGGGVGIYNSYSEADVIGSNHYVGGISGYGTTIERSYSSGDVSSNAGGHWVGGLVGQAGDWTVVNVRYSFAMGAVFTSSSNFGGIAGLINANATLTDVYWDETRTGMAACFQSNSGTVNSCSAVNAGNSNPTYFELGLNAPIYFGVGDARNWDTTTIWDVSSGLPTLRRARY